MVREYQLGIVETFKTSHHSRNFVRTLSIEVCSARSHQSHCHPRRTKHEGQNFRSIRESKSLDLEGQAAWLPWPEAEDGFSSSPIPTPNGTPLATPQLELPPVMDRSASGSSHGRPSYLGKEVKSEEPQNQSGNFATAV